MKPVVAIGSMSILSLFALLSVQCGGGGSSGSSSAAFESKCQRMCQHLIAAPLSGCSKSQATSVDVCRPECVKHMNPKAPGDAPEATEPELDCAITAATCDAWNACGDFL